FQLLNQLAQIAGRAASRVVDQVGMVAGDANVSARHALSPHLLQEIGRRRLPLTDDSGRRLRRHVLRELGNQKILENPSCALHRSRELLIANLEDVVRYPPEALGIGRLQDQLGGKYDPLLVVFEDALAIAEIALFVVEHTNPAVIEEADIANALGEGVAISAGITVNGGADPSRDARERLQPLQPA